MTTRFTYTTQGGDVLYTESRPAQHAPWVGQQAVIPIPPTVRGPLFVDQVHGRPEGYTIVVRPI